ncbi:MAG: carboxypeptidase-like regulatory domain-containing protein [Pyrinomonadaceae bacterium]
MAPLASAQFSSGVQGVVQDASRAVVPNAIVKLRDPQRNITQETKTNESGYFRFSSLAPGDYEVSAEATNFQTKTQTVTLTTGQNRDLNFDLEAGQLAAETVNVTTEVPQLDTAETRVQLTLEARKLRDLPLQNNSIFPLMALAPGVTGTNPASDNFNPEYFSGMSANGRSAAGNTFNVDGLSVTSNITNGTSNLAPNPEAIQEVTIETNTFRADQGLGSSIVVSVTTKSGTNDFHGAANYWFTNQKLRARTSLPFIAEYAPFSRKDFSGAIGGPVFLPTFGEGGKGYYDGRNKTFFFAAVERLRSTNAQTGVETYEAPEFVAFARQNFPNTIGTNLLTSFPVDGPVQTNVLRRAQDILGDTCGTAATANIPCNLPLLVQGTWSRSPARTGLNTTFAAISMWERKTVSMPALVGLSPIRKFSSIVQRSIIRRVVLSTPFKPIGHTHLALQC